MTDPRTDRQAVVEASYVNIPCIALCDTDSPLDFVDVAIPCNNRATESIAMIYWMIAREVLVLRGELDVDAEWDVVVDLFYYKETDHSAQKVAVGPVDLDDKEVNADWDKEEGEKKEEADEKWQ